MRKQLVSGSIATTLRYCPYNLLKNVEGTGRSVHCSRLNWTAASVGTVGASGVNTPPSFYSQLILFFHKHVIIKCFMIIFCHYTLFAHSNSLQTTSHCSEDTVRCRRLVTQVVPFPAIFVNFVLFSTFVFFCSFSFPNKNYRTEIVESV